MRQISENEFDTQFTTVKNHLDDNASFGGCLFETYGTELDYVFEKSKITKNVWTYIEGDEGLYIVTGFHRVNRLGFLITDEPYTEEIEVKIDEV